MLQEFCTKSLDDIDKTLFYHNSLQQILLTPLVKGMVQYWVLAVPDNGFPNFQEKHGT